METTKQSTNCCCESKSGIVFSPEQIKEVVRERYAQVIQTRSCCGGGEKTKAWVDGYDKLEGYVPTADYGLGCGIPTEHAMIEPGNTVLDLGSGAGNDVFVARALVRETGKVIGLDFTDEMIAKANENNQKMGYSNTHFIKGEIENIPLENETIDVVVSNCVINLVPNKLRAFSEIYRVLRQGGHFCISDMVINGEMEAEMRNDLSLYSGCIAGAVREDEYIAMVKEVGFTEVCIKSKRTVINLRDHLDAKYSVQKAEAMWQLKDSLFSINLYASK